ncbi:hypothetical protein [Phenylobacterium deserti]|uniref:Uncharacterized protein n=1 Tax=Phenylobacterium deserti TaxID=1914756 RepID=A0A328AVD6_9CAUL|nr:hypothetical protein [Phenylobacterium deserti]RAK57524.1 hypothetical protein DJ018_06200 [Phenylobacterium deserti]
MPFWTLIVAALAFAALAVGAFAIVRGTVAERIAGAVFISSVPVFLAISRLPEAWFTLAQLSCDALYAFAFLGLAMWFASRWLGAIMILYALQFALHATYMVAGWEPDKLHVLANNLIYIATMLCLLFGTLGARARQRAAPPAAPA